MIPVQTRPLALFHLILSFNLAAVTTVCNYMFIPIESSRKIRTPAMGLPCLGHLAGAQ